MRARIAILIALVSLAVVASSAWAEEAKRPLVLVFDTTIGDGADKDLAASATKAIRNYLRDTQRVEAAAFDRSSATVQRAIMENKLTADMVASYSSQTERLNVAKALGFQYAAGAEVSLKELKVAAIGRSVLKVKDEPPPKPEGEKAKDPAGSENAEQKKNVETPTRVITVVQVKLWLAQVDGGKNSKPEVLGSADIGGGSKADLENALQSAASSAVLEVAHKLLAELPRIAEPLPTTGQESTAIGSDGVPKITQPSASEYATKGDKSLAQGNIALAIEQYLSAVNTDPNDAALRVKLAEAYAQRGMYQEANDVLRRAKAAGMDPGALEAAAARIEQMKTSPAPSTAKGVDKTTTTPQHTENRVRLTPDRPNATPAIQKLIEGDKLWNAGEPDEAAEAYKQSIQLNPNDWRAYERLAAANASMSLFGESRKTLEQLAKVQPEPSARVLENRHKMLLGYFDQHFNSLLDQYDSAGAGFDRKSVTRESYYNIVKGLAIRLESMASFLDAMTVPKAKQPSHLRRSLACGLMAQAASSLLDYLESNNAKSKSNAAVFVSQAKAEMQTAAKLDEPKAAESQPSTDQPSQ